MDTKLAFAATAAAVLSSVGTAAAQSQWKHVGTIGMRQLVLVDPAVASDAAVLRQAAESVCTPDQACVVAFWSEAAAVPASMPMTAAQQRAVVAQYLRNPASGAEELLMKCDATTPEGVKCLR